MGNLSVQDIAALAELGLALAAQLDSLLAGLHAGVTSDDPAIISAAIDKAHADSLATTAKIEALRTALNPG